MVPDVFEKKYAVQLNFCEMTGDIKCTSPGNSKEEWEGDEFINSSLKMIRFTNTFFNELNQYYDNKGLFEFRISNGQEVLVDDMSSVVREFDDGEQKVRTVFYYKLIHKPKY